MWCEASSVDVSTTVIDMSQVNRSQFEKLFTNVSKQYKRLMKLALHWLDLTCIFDIKTTLAAGSGYFKFLWGLARLARAQKF